MQMDAGLDTGPILAQHCITVDARETTGTLTRKISDLCAEVTRQQIPRVLKAQLTPRDQNPERATWAPPIGAADRKLDFTAPAAVLDARVRALSPAPAALTTCRGRMLRVLETLPLAENLGLQPGTVHVAGSRRILIATPTGSLELVRAQFEGKKPLSAGDLLNGRSIAAGDQLGS
jgi:methionyl-tRNA formyltransferase